MCKFKSLNKNRYLIKLYLIFPLKTFYYPQLLKDRSPIDPWTRAHQGTISSWGPKALLTRTLLRRSNSVSHPALDVPHRWRSRNRMIIYLFVPREETKPWLRSEWVTLPRVPWNLRPKVPTKTLFSLPRVPWEEIRYPSKGARDPSIKSKVPLGMKIRNLRSIKVSMFKFRIVN